MPKAPHNPPFRWILALVILLVLPVITARATTLLKYGQPNGGSLAAGQTADYTFEGKAGDKPIIAMNAHGGSMVPHVALYDAQGRLIGEDSNGGAKGDALLKGSVLPVDGVYRVQAANNAPSGNGKYSLVVTEEKHQVYFDGNEANKPAGVKQNYQLTTPWDHTHITYHIANTLSHFNAQDVNAVLARALQSWANVTPLIFTEVAGRGDINIQFAQIDGPLNILGETCPPGNPCAGDVTLDSEESWALGDPQGYQDISLLGVASHELGHAIGLLHTNDSTALMYPEYSPYTLQPAADDIAGVQRLYGPGSGRVSNPTALPGLPSATGVPAGQLQVSGQLDNTKFAHFWDFDVQAGDTVTITMHATSGDLDSFLVLIDTNNHVLAYDDDSGGGKDAQLRNLKFPQGGTYTVAATRYAQAQGYTTGAYTLGIEYGAVAGAAPTLGVTSTPASAPQSGLVKVSAGQAAQLGQLPSLDSILVSPFANSATPGKQARSGTVSSTQSYTWGQQWCATDAKTLSASEANISPKFTVNNQAVDSKLITQAPVPNNQFSCTEYFVVLSNWSAGNVVLTATLTLNKAVFDGQTISPPGDYVYEYDIQVQ